MYFNNVKCNYFCTNLIISCIHTLCNLFIFLWTYWSPSIFPEGSDAQDWTQSQVGPPSEHPQQSSTPSILGLSLPLVQGNILGVKHNYLSLFLLFCSLNYLLKTFIWLFNKTTRLFSSITFAHQNPEHRGQVSLQFATNVPPVTRSHRS